MVETVVGYGPLTDFFPHVPDLLIVQDELGRRRVISRQGDSSLSEERLFAAKKARHCVPEPVRVGKWPMFGKERVEWFALSEERSWRAKRAQEVLGEVSSLKGRPEEALALVRAASALASVDLEKIVREIASLSAPGESLSAAYGRTKASGR